MLKGLFDKTLAAGSYRFAWDGESDNGTRVAPGVYFARARVGAKDMREKLVVLR
jgi:hypothetical protein